MEGLFIATIQDQYRDRSGEALVLEIILIAKAGSRYSHLCWQGDSGSVFWEAGKRPRPVAQLVSNDLLGTTGYGQPIETVLERLGVVMVNELPRA